MDVNFCNNAQVANNGTLTAGPASAHHRLYGMETIVSPTRAPTVEDGTILFKVVNAWITKYGLMTPVFHHKSLVKTAVFGTIIFTHVHALKAHSLPPQDVTLCPSAPTEKYTTHLTMFVNAHSVSLKKEECALQPIAHLANFGVFLAAK